jgi:hypothetical protein
MTAHFDLLDRYKQIRDVRFQLNNLLVGTIPKKTLEDCGRKLGIFRKGTLVFGSEAEMSVLMDYCLYYRDPHGGSLVARYLENSPPPADSIEMTVRWAMTGAYYSLFMITDVERGVSVQDLLRDETAFIVDIGLGNTAQRHLILASRIIPIEGFLTTGGAALPVNPAAARRILDELTRMNQTPETFDFKRISPLKEAELAALVIRTCLCSGTSSNVVYAEPGGQNRSPTGRWEAARPGRNDSCPCGSGKKFKMCCGRR